MGAVAPTKNERKAPITKVPSFVLRQDGCELSYEVGAIIAENPGDVNKNCRDVLINPPPGGGWPSIARSVEEWRQNRYGTTPIHFLTFHIIARIPLPPPSGAPS